MPNGNPDVCSILKGVGSVRGEGEGHRRSTDRWLQLRYPERRRDTGDTRTSFRRPRLCTCNERRRRRRYSGLWPGALAN